MYQHYCCEKRRENEIKKGCDLYKVKGPTFAGPLILTNPLNSVAKLQIAATLQNYF